MKYFKLHFSERSSPPILNYYLRVEMIGVSPQKTTSRIRALSIELNGVKDHFFVCKSH